MSIYKLIWDYFKLIIILVYFFIIPLDISFNKPLKFFLGFEFHGIFVSLLILDIVIRINTAYFEKGMLIESRKKII